MQTLFFMSLTSAFVSLLAGLGFSVMTIVPSPGAESFRARLLLVSGAFVIGWLALAFWSRPRPRDRLPPAWLLGLLVAFSVVYCFGVFFSVLA